MYNPRRYCSGPVVAGVIGAAGNDRRGVTGVCWRVALMPLRTINSLGVGDVASAVRAVAYATHMGARLTNNSWGRIPDVRSLRDVIEQARTAGVLFVAAAGNGGLDDDVTPHFPSGYPHDNVLSVAATDENDQLARFSNFGATTVDLAAPGSAILSTFTQGRFISLSGTSLSTPFVSGALALAIARARLVPYGVLRDALLATVDRKPTLAATMVSGGRLNLRRLLEVLDVTPPDPVTGLEVESVPGSRATLRWIAPADGAGGGAVAGYDIRYAAGALDPADLERAAAAPFVGVPGAPGLRRGDHDHPDDEQDHQGRKEEHRDEQGGQRSREHHEVRQLALKEHRPDEKDEDAHDGQADLSGIHGSLPGVSRQSRGDWTRGNAFQSRDL